jgi:hypothetical protein
MDFLNAPTLTLGMTYYFFVISHWSARSFLYQLL